MKPSLAMKFGASLLLGSFLAPVTVAQDASESPLADLLERLGEDVRVYNEHVVTLSSPFMDGRLPGTRGMEIATQYMEYWLERAGCEPAFPAIQADGSPGAPFSSWRQPFELGGTLELASQALAVRGGGDYAGGTDFAALGLGTSGTASGPVTFVGYSIESSQRDYTSFGEVEDLSGRIAMMFRFEPMDADGKSQWSTRGGWSQAAGFAGKVAAVAKRKPAAILIVNPPGAADPRIEEDLLGVGAGGARSASAPVFHVSVDAGERIVRELGSGRSLLELRRHADEGGAPLDLGGHLEVSAEIERTPQIAENVAGVLRGAGDLADEWIVIGAHLDHLGMGNFGSREGPGKLHPGADDNASGSAAILMLADRLSQEAEANPNRRSVLLMGFSAEESGLNGSAYYVRNPIAPIEDHAFMINFDMIGRIVNKRLSVSGAQTGVGLGEMLAPLFDESPLEIVQPENMSGASDHTPFFRAGVPVLFGIIADFHDDYHTSRDTSEKINRVDAVHTIHLFHRIAQELTFRNRRFEYVGGNGNRRRDTARREAPEEPEEIVEEPEAPPAGTGRAALRVRFGIRPGNYDGAGGGVLVGGVLEDTSASEAGLQEGDRLVLWNGKPIDDVAGWMGLMMPHAPGDKVQVTVDRDGEDVVLWVTLRGLADDGDD